MEPKTTIQNNELQIKENWSKPEINLIGINEETLGTTGIAATDGLTFS